MTWKARTMVCIALSVAAALPAVAQSGRAALTGADSSNVITLQRQWWEALSSADTAVLLRRSSERLSATLSGGRVLDRAALVHAADGPKHSINTQWSAERIQAATPSLVVARAEAVESEDSRGSHYLYQTVMAREGGQWRVVAAQSTRMPVFTPRTAMPADRSAFAGSYRTPRGLALRVVVSDSMLTMFEPSGLELHYWPIGPQLFESGSVSPDGAITRLSFVRDSLGKVSTLTVLSPGVVISFPRM